LDWCILGLCAIGGYGLSQAIRFQAGLMIFPMLLSAAVHATGLTQAAPPSWLVSLVQVVIGGIVGARFAAISWREMQRTLACAVVWAAALIAIAAVSAWSGGWLIGRSFLAMLLALAPGGTVEITILAFSIGFEVAFVVTCQICRILFVLLLAPVFVSLLARKDGPADPPSGR
jgi:membrane AbrB-like protein